MQQIGIFSEVFAVPSYSKHFQLALVHFGDDFVESIKTFMCFLNWNCENTK